MISEKSNFGGASGAYDLDQARSDVTKKPSKISNFFSNIFSSKNKDTVHGLNEKLKKNSEVISVWAIIIAIIAVIVLYIVSCFLASNTTVWTMCIGFGLIVICTLILFLFVNLCLNYQGNKKNTNVNDLLSTDNMQSTAL